MVSPSGRFLGNDGRINQPASGNHNGPTPYDRYINMRATLNVLANNLRHILPAGCPMVIGGGLVRDAIMGGVPGDIDIWLPSNIQIPPASTPLAMGGPQNVGRFASFLRDQLGLAEYPRVVFSIGNPTHQDPMGQLDLADPRGMSDAYRDVSNHWVVEFEHRGFTINIMRSMVPWQHDSQGFFNNLMRNFDMDMAMFFIGIETESSVLPITTHAIMPLHIIRQLQEEQPITRWQWNQARHTMTSTDRLRLRANKLNSRYSFEQDPGIIATDSIIATPVELSFVMEAQSLFPFPQPPELADLRTTRQALQQAGRRAQSEEIWGYAGLSRRTREALARMAETPIPTAGFDALIRAREMQEEQRRINAVMEEAINRQAGIHPGMPTNPWGHIGQAAPPPQPWDGAFAPQRQVTPRDVTATDVNLARISLNTAEFNQWVNELSTIDGAIVSQAWRDRITRTPSNNMFVNPTAGAGTAPRATMNPDNNF